MLTRLPQPDHLELAARYRPAGGPRARSAATGTTPWCMPDGATTSMVGDVVGHDIGAAAVMGQLRTMLRAFAWTHDDPPARNVERLDRASLDLELGAMATLVPARIEQTEAEAAQGRAGCAGPPRATRPRCCCTPTGPSTLLGGGRGDDPMLGAGAGAGPPRPDRRPARRVDAAALHRRPGRAPRGAPRRRPGPGPGAVARHGGGRCRSFLDGILAELVGDAPGRRRRAARRPGPPERAEAPPGGRWRDRTRGARAGRL